MTSDMKNVDKKNFLKPKFIKLEIIISNIGMPFICSIGLGVLSVKGRNLLPKPPARIITGD